MYYNAGAAGGPRGVFLSNRVHAEIYTPERAGCQEMEM